MPNVNKNNLIKLVIQSGLTPIEDSWKVKKEYQSGGYLYSPYYEYEYILKTVEGVDIIGCRLSNDEGADFDIMVYERKLLDKAKKLSSLIKEVGHKSDVFISNNIKNYKYLSSDSIYRNLLFEDELKLVEEYINKLIKGEIKC